MSFGKAKTPAAPDYTPVAKANEKAADLSFELGQDQLDWAKDTYNQYWPYVQDYLSAQTATTDENRDRANDYYDYYLDTYQPIETKYADTALNYATPERTEQRAATAMADVTNQYEAQRRSALANLESYGIDPSQTRYGALDLSSRVQQAAATAAAGTKSRLNTEAVELGLMGEAINTGRGYASNTSGAYDTATRAGAAGATAGTSLYSTGASAMGSPTSYLASGNTALGNWGTTLNNSFNNETTSANIQNQNVANTWKGIGSLVGGGLGFFM